MCRQPPLGQHGGRRGQVTPAARHPHSRPCSGLCLRLVTRTDCPPPPRGSLTAPLLGLGQTGTEMVENERLGVGRGARSQAGLHPALPGEAPSLSALPPAAGRGPGSGSASSSPGTFSARDRGHVAFVPPWVVTLSLAPAGDPPGPRVPHLVPWGRLLLASVGGAGAWFLWKGGGGPPPPPLRAYLEHREQLTWDHSMLLRASDPVLGGRPHGGSTRAVP